MRRRMLTRAIPSGEQQPENIRAACDAARIFPRIRNSTGSMSRWVTPPACLEQEPSTPLRLINPHFDQAGSRNVAVVIGHVVRFTQSRCKVFVVVPKLRKHVQRLHVVGIIVEYSLRAGDVADR